MDFISTVLQEVNEKLVDVDQALTSVIGYARGLEAAIEKGGLTPDSFKELQQQNLNLEIANQTLQVENEKLRSKVQDLAWNGTTKPVQP